MPITPPPTPAPVVEQLTTDAPAPRPDDPAPALTARDLAAIAGLLQQSETRMLQAVDARCAALAAGIAAGMGDSKVRAAARALLGELTKAELALDDVELAAVRMRAAAEGILLGGADGVTEPAPQ